VAKTDVRDIVEALDISEEQADALITKYIRQDPNHPGRHEAWADSGTWGAPVRHLIPYLRVADADEVAQTYGLPVEAIFAAVAYYRRHRALFEARFLLEAEEDAQREEGIAAGWITNWRPVDRPD
jgi:hypothetical protein